MWKEDFWSPERNVEAYNYVFKTLSSICSSTPKTSYKKYLLIIVGDGLQPQEGYVRREYRLHDLENQLGRKPSEKEIEKLDKEMWEDNEDSRQVSSRHAPRLAYVLVWYLLKEGFAKVIVTSNFDRFLNSIFLKTEMQYVLNPTKDSHSIGHPIRYTKGYYQWRKYSSDSVRLWKYHGDVGFFSFPKCLCIFPLPETRTSNKDLQTILNIRQQLFHFHRRKTRISKHHIDFDYDEIPRMDIFSPEIEGAKKELSSEILEQISGILILGFTGRWNNKIELRDRASEEIVPSILELAQNGIPVMMLLNPIKPRYLSESWLCRRLLEIEPKSVIAGPIEGNLPKLFGEIPTLKPALFYDIAWRARKLFVYKNEGE